MSILKLLGYAILMGGIIAGVSLGSGFFWLWVLGQFLSLN